MHNVFVYTKTAQTHDAIIYILYCNGISVHDVMGDDANLSHVSQFGYLTMTMLCSIRHIY